MSFPRRRFFVLALFAVLMMMVGAFSVGAQDAGAVNGTLVQGSPLVGTLENGSQVLRFAYNAPDLRAVTIQALSETIQPTLRVLRGDTVIAEEANVTGQPVASLTAVLTAGAYIVEVGAFNDASGTLIVLVDSEAPVTAENLALGSALNREVNATVPSALFTFGGLTEEAYLYIDAAAGTNPTARLTNTETTNVSAVMDADALGLRVRLPAGTANYLLEVAFRADAGSTVQPFALCLTAVSVNTCEAGSVPVAAPTLDPAAPVTTPEVGSGAACTVTPNVAGGVNIRQSATVNSIIAGALPGGAVAEVLGKSPDNAWFNIRFNNITGWVAASVVNLSGDCANVPVVNPPAPIFPTNTPTATPIPPTAAPTATATPSGPCLISLFAATNVYQSPNADISNLQDQVGAGGELIPNGRLADNSWWRTNYGGAWIQTSTFGVTANVTGNCSALPIVSP